MSLSSLTQATDQAIADYLAHTPDFFERHADLLASVQLFGPHGDRAVCLQERQASLLRDKIAMQEQRITDMIHNVNDNMVLSDKLLLWAQALLLHTDITTLPQQMVDELTRQFTVPQVSIKVWNVAKRYAQSDFAQGVSDDVKQFANALTQPLCGVNTGLEVATWLPDPQAALSLAILPLREVPTDQTLVTPLAPAFGVLVLASHDEHRFHSGTGTDFLVRLADLASAALSKLRSS